MMMKLQLLPDRKRRLLTEHWAEKKLKEADGGSKTADDSETKGDQDKTEETKGDQDKTEETKGDQDKTEETEDKSEDEYKPLPVGSKIGTFKVVIKMWELWNILDLDIGLAAALMIDFSNWFITKRSA